MLALAMLLYLVLAGLVLHSSWRLYQAILAEKPEWLRYDGEPSLFYSGMPRILDPNVNFKVLGVAFTGKAGLLAAPDASRHAQIIRVALPLALLDFCFVMACLVVQKAA
jgi:hypothetical protein